MKLIIYLLAVSTALVAGTCLVQFNRSIEISRIRIAQENGDLSSQVANRLEDKLGQLSHGWLDPGTERRSKVEEFQTSIAHDEEISLRCAWITGISLAVAILAGIAAPFENRRKLLAVPILCSWILGILLPVLKITVATSLDHLGTIVIREESKSLILMLKNLSSQENWLMVLTRALNR